MSESASRGGETGRARERASGPALLALALVAACGGTGSTPPPPPTNHAPAATAASVVVAEDGSLPVVLSGTDADGDPLTFQVTPPSHGTLEGTPPSLTYRPTPLFHGTDAFTFTVSDGRITSAPATVQIEVTHVNHPPSALAGQAQAQEDGSVTFDLAGSDPDGDPLIFAVASPPSHGTLVLAGASATYTPTPLWSGGDAFTFTVSDGQATSPPAAVALVVTHVNHPPVAVADVALTVRDGPVTIDVLANDHDPDGDPLTPSVATRPAHGAAALAGTRVAYTPEAGWMGDDAFTYQASDGAGGTATGQVTVHVLAPGALAGTTAFGSKGGSLGLAGLAPLADGSFVVAGVFDGTLVLGAVPSYRTFNAGTDPGTGTDAFVARVRADGQLLWSSWISSAGYCQAWAFAALPDGGVAVGGRFQGPLTFDVGAASQETVPSLSGDLYDTDAFLVVYGPDGVRRWQKVLGSPTLLGGYQDEVMALAAAPDGSGLVAAVLLADGGTFGRGEPGEVTFTGRQDVLARFKADGTLAWAAGRAAQSYDGFRGVALAGTGAVYATGWFGATAVFGAGQPNETTLVAGGDADVFLARYEAGGAFGWVRQPQGADRDEGAAVALTPDGTGLVLTGRYAWPASGSGSGTITFGAGAPGAVTLTSVNRGAAFVAGYATDGTFDGWARSAGGAGGGFSVGVTVLPDGSLVALDNFQGSPAVLGPGEPGQVSFSVANYVVARMDASGLLQWATDTGTGTGAVTCLVTPGRSADGALLQCPATMGSQLVVASFVP